MKNWRLWFPRKPRADIFLKMICEQAAHAQHGLEVLHAYMREPGEDKAAQVRSIEKEADEARRVLIDELNRSFITPIDPEDIHSISTTLDNVLDGIEDT